MLDKELMDKSKIAIVGVGNSLMGDEGIGIHAIQYLGLFDWPENVELIDAGVPGPSLLYILEEHNFSIIIDCADFKAPAGNILVVEPEQLKKAEDEIGSLHETSLLGTLALAEELNLKIGQVILICIQPKSIEISTDISHEAFSALPNIKEQIQKILQIG